MKILTNKFFIIGNLLLLLIAIPVTLFFIKQQQQTRSKAAPSSKLYFQPETTSTSTQCPTFAVDLMVDPGSNIVSIVDAYLTYDPTKFEIQEIKESESFPTVVRAPSISAGAADFSVSIGSDVTKAVQAPAKVATITLKPLVAGAGQLQLDQAKSRVFSLAPADQPTENVLFQSTPGTVNITSDVCPGATPGVSPSVSPTSAPSISPTQAISPTTTANQVPTCTNLSASPASTVSAPFSVLFTAQGSDPDASGLVTQGTFDFGDGTPTQNVTSGLNLQNVTVQASHTYSNAGTFAATATFTDNQGGVSSACSLSMEVSAGSGSATVAPTSAPTSVPATATPAPQPTIPPTGITVQTVGIFTAVLLTIVGGFVLLAL